MKYAIRQDGETIHDPNWHCIADVIASHRGWHNHERRLTGLLMVRRHGRWVRA